MDCWCQANRTPLFRCSAPSTWRRLPPVSVHQLYLNHWRWLRGGLWAVLEDTHICLLSQLLACKLLIVFLFEQIQPEHIITSWYDCAKFIHCIEFRRLIFFLAFNFGLWLYILESKDRNLHWQQICFIVVGDNIQQRQKLACQVQCVDCVS